MKRYLIIILLMVICLPATAQNPQVKSGVLMIGLVVEDITESEKFYTEVLGMTPTGEFSLGESWSEQAGMASGAFSVRTFTMNSRESATVLKLAYFEEGTAAGTDKLANEQAGVNYLTFLYDDLGPLRKRILERDIPVVGTVGDNLIIIRDPNGIFIELYQPPK